jgi:hypothetical protein
MSDAEASMRRYLLGDLPADERDRLEESYFADNAQFELLETIEDELVDDFVYGTLSRQEQQQFLSHYLSTSKRRQRVTLARSLKAMAKAPPPFSSRVWERLTAPVRLPIVAVAATALVLIGSFTALVRFFDLRQQLLHERAMRHELEQRASQPAQPQVQLPPPQRAAPEPKPTGRNEQVLQLRIEEMATAQDILQTQLAEQTERAKKLEAELDRARQSAARVEQPPVLIARHTDLSVSPSQFVRGAGATRKWTAFAAGVDQLHLHLRLPGGTARETYRAVITTPEGQQVFQSDVQAAKSDTTVTLRIPANRLRPGEHIVTLFAGDTKIAEYEFGIDAI